MFGNLCHWTDFSLQMIPAAERYPIRIIPVKADANDCDIAVSFVFGEGSIATITFSAKGYVFEGVYEKLYAQKGNLLISLTDFGELVMQNGTRKQRYRPLFRQHGHLHSILASYRMSLRGGGASGVDLDYVRQTAEFFLATRAALETDRELVLDSLSSSSELNSPMPKHPETVVTSLAQDSRLPKAPGIRAAGTALSDVPARTDG